MLDMMIGIVYILLTWFAAQMATCGFGFLVLRLFRQNISSFEIGPVVVLAGLGFSTRFFSDPALVISDKRHSKRNTVCSWGSWVQSVIENSLSIISSECSARLALAAHYAVICYLAGQSSNGSRDN